QWTSVVFGQEDALDGTHIASGIRRLANEARLLVRQRLGSRLLDVLSRVAERRGNPLHVSERGLSQIRQQVCHLCIEGVSNEWNQLCRHFRSVCLPACNQIASDGQAEHPPLISQSVLRFLRIAAQRAQPVTKVYELRFHTFILTRRFVASRTSWASEFFSTSFSAGSASAWLGAWFLVRSSFSSISPWRRVNS